MKKLVIFDHTGTQRFQSDVFVEGQDFKWESPVPTAFWIGTIMLIEESEFNEMRGIKVIEPISELVAEREPTPEVASVGEEIKEEEAELVEQVPFTTQEPTIEVSFKCVHVWVYQGNEMYECSQCGARKGEVKHEPETVSDKSSGDKRAGKTGKPKSLKAKAKDSKGGTISRGSKRV